MRWMRAWLGFTAIALTTCGGGDGPAEPKRPIDAVPVDLTIKTGVTTAQLGARVDIARDKLGIPHVYGANEHDLFFANGWIEAHDRLMQMQVFRYIAAGRLTELFGALQEDVIDGDITMRQHRIRALAEDSLVELRKSTDATDLAIVDMLDSYAAGVNAYVAALARHEYTLDEAIGNWFDASKWEPWTAADSLSIGRLQQFSLSEDEIEVQLTRARQMWKQVFDNAADGTPEKLRAGGFADLYQTAPMDATATIDAWPNVSADTGTRAFGLSSPVERRAPELPMALLDALRGSQSGVPWLRFATNRSIGSNNWVVAGKHTASGQPMLANDTHLPMLSPSIWYQLQLSAPASAKAAGVDVEGVAFPGIPGVMIGRTPHLAWGATVAVHDVTDLYQEEIVTCAAGGGDCVKFKGQEVPIATRMETFKIGAVGTILRSKTFKFETVPHHGPIAQVVTNHEVVERSGPGTAVSIAYTGHVISQDLRTFYNLIHAKDQKDAFAAFKDFTFGAFNWVFIDDGGNIGWTQAAKVPRRPPAAMTYDRKTNRDGTAPFLILPGDGSCEWMGYLDPRYIPHAVNPDKGYLVTANADPVGETFDNNPLNGPMVDGAPLFVSGTYDPGFRVGRITRLLKAKIDAGQKLTVADMQTIQADAYNGFAEKIRPYLATARMRLDAELATPGASPDLLTLAVALKADAPRLARLHDGADRIAAWSLDTPAAMAGSPSAAEIADSIATSIFDGFWLKTVDLAVGDELARIGERPEIYLADRAVLALLERPGDVIVGNHPSTGTSALWDDLRTPEIESRDAILLKGLEQGILYMAGPTVMDSADVTTWRWGKVHRLQVPSKMVPNNTLDLPPANDPNPLNKGGFPRHGDNHTVDVANWKTGPSFTYEDGAAIRFVAEVQAGGGIKAKNALPGGQVFDPRDKHYRDLLDGYYLDNKSYDLAYGDAEVIAAVETHWLLTR